MVAGLGRKAGESPAAGGGNTPASAQPAKAGKKIKKTGGIIMMKKKI